MVWFSLDLRLREDSITNEQWYFAMVNITRGWIHVRDDRFSKFRNSKNLRSLESFGKRHVIINWHTQRARRKISLIPSALPNVVLVIACRWIVGILKIDAMEPQEINQYRNLHAEVYFEATRFCIACDQRQYRMCAGYAPCSWCLNYARFLHWPN